MLYIKEKEYTSGKRDENVRRAFEALIYIALTW